MTREEAQRLYMGDGIITEFRCSIEQAHDTFRPFRGLADVHVTTGPPRIVLNVRIDGCELHRHGDGCNRLAGNLYGLAEHHAAGSPEYEVMVSVEMTFLRTRSLPGAIFRDASLMPGGELINYVTEFSRRLFVQTRSMAVGREGQPAEPPRLWAQNVEVAPVRPQIDVATASTGELLMAMRRARTEGPPAPAVPAIPQAARHGRRLDWED